jgi:hypothetical protein
VKYERRLHLASMQLHITTAECVVEETRMACSTMQRMRHELRSTPKKARILTPDMINRKPTL